mmetsp:Transcript_9529/g.11138  ORF Transcript_9529/g.11138 Transcript_9529/m.11138 type:complete len:373 (-) Transcript_9529:67-1185(-)
MITPTAVLTLLLSCTSSAFLILSPSKCKSPPHLQYQPQEVQLQQQLIISFRTTQHVQKQHPLPSFLHMTNNPDENSEDKPPLSSQIEGNREPSPQDISIMDDMITKLSNAKPYELPNAVSKAIRVVSSPRFFIRIAERVDVEQNPEEREKLSALAENLIATINAVVSTTEDKLDDRAKSVEDVMLAAAEPGTGEFMVPLSRERVDAMRIAMEKLDPDTLDEGFLTTVDAWMNKSQQDGMDGMVGIMQKVLQQYAGIAISRARLELQASVGAAVAGKGQAKADVLLAEQEAAGLTTAAAFMERLMKVDADSWDGELLGAFQKKEIKPMSITGEVQRTIEAVVLGLENGSMAQRVQAEFLKELVTRIEVNEKKA